MRGKGRGRILQGTSQNIFSGDDKDKGPGWECLKLFPVLLLAGRGQILGPPRVSPHRQPHFIVEGLHPTFCTHVAAGDDAITPGTDHVGLHGAAPPVRAGARGIVHNQQLSLLQDVRSSPVG